MTTKNNVKTHERKTSTMIACNNPYDYYRPGKCRRLTDTRISPAHQGPVNLSPTSNRHLAPVGFMSQSSGIVQRSAVSILHQTSVRELSVKSPQNFQSRSIVQTPHPFSFKLETNLDTFSSLTLKDRLLPKKISGISHKRKFDKESTMTGKSTSENILP